MKIREFGVEMWMNAYENDCELNLAETCVASVTLEQLTQLAGKNDTVLSDIMSMKMTYGAIEGSDRLRDAICTLYETQKRENVVTTHGTIGANALIYKTLVHPGDHVVAVLPTYQQHYSIPESQGADVSILQLREEDGFLPDLDGLKALIRPDTKLIALNNPNNPTGALMAREMLEQIAELARTCGAYVLCDEVYRGTAQDGDGMTVSMADIYEKGIATASMSKAFSLAGLRVGWITGPQDVIAQVMIHRDYDTISVSQLDEYFATMALEAKEKLLTRSRDLTRRNLEVLDAWIEAEPRLTYVRPKAATICLLKYDMDMGSHPLAVDILKETGVLLTPGSAFDMEGYLRIGFANSTEVLQTGLTSLGGYLRRYD
ncbi:aminotransferase [uncultured Litoreibacter sp.]|uniref:aminotransferase n=1 Tax=uncultured Litoreibacter sp. TaxID=1392394 RepID=UPI00262C19D2|nr:aminotransferase [uncultured Litoreibacter sp.]